MTRAATCIAALAVAVIAQAAQVNLGAVDDWEDYPSGLLPLSDKWKLYSSMSVLKHPPMIVVDKGRRALQLKTDRETVAIGRTVRVDIATSSTLVWEWKPLAVGTSPCSSRTCLGAGSDAIL